jgi:type I restriction enzyme M protein
VVGLPANLFYGAGIPAALLIFDKSRKPNGKDPVLFIDASSEFEQGTNQNRLRQQDIAKIIDTFHRRKVIEKYSHLAKFVEMEENGFNLNIPRYVDTFEPEPEIDLNEVHDDIARIETELAAVESKMGKYLEEFGFKR